MKHLLIVESPAKIKTIKKFLGNDFVIMSTLGHVKDLPKRKVGVSFEDGKILLEYVPLDKKAKVIADICKQATKSDHIYLAPDPDREGEAIAWHIEQEVQKVIKDPSQIHRITFNELTKPALQESLQTPSTIDNNKVAAQQARRVLDRWVGYEVSPILWKKVQKGLSAGRVQSVALRLICDRETEIRAFKPEEYWSIEGLFSYRESDIQTTLYQVNKKKPTIKNEKSAQKLVADIPQRQYTITSVKDSKRKKNPNAPFITSTLQQAAYNRLGFKVQRTMQIAQKLYEGLPLDDPQNPTALITYMRTDSTRISDTAIKQVRSYISTAFSKEYLPSKSLVYAKGKKQAQDAHEAIRPVDTQRTPDAVKKYLDNDSYRLYKLIWDRFVACQMKAAQYAQRQVIISGGPYTFKATGSTLLFDGFMKVYASDDKKDKETTMLPRTLNEKDPVDLKKVSPKQHFTQPPARYTEASLVKELEKEGIGRPSTYATIMRTIQARAYTNLDEKKRFFPTELGQTVTDLLKENLPKIMDISFTAHMEEDLDKIAQGDIERDKVLTEFYEDFSQSVTKFAGEAKSRKAEPTAITCPECKEHKLIIRFGKAGAFVGCPSFPECTFTSNFERQEDSTIKLVKREEPQLLDEKCPKCESPLQQRVGRYGPFSSCSGYPKCKYIKQEVASFPCPQCGGELTKRNWRGKTFWGCQNYPKCKFSIPGEIEQTPCPSCKNPYRLKRKKDGQEVLLCPNKECDTNK